MIEYVKQTYLAYIIILSLSLSLSLTC